MGIDFWTPTRRCQPKFCTSDYENRPWSIKNRGSELLDGRVANNLYFKAYEHLSDRDVGFLDTAEFAQLKELVVDQKPGLLIIDPLRYATGAEIKAENALELMDKVSELRSLSPTMSLSWYITFVRLNGVHGWL